MHGLCGFLGLVGYYLRFIQDYGAIAAPLMQLLKKEGFTWSPKATTTFDVLKQALSSALVLQLPNFDKPFFMDYDVSGSGFWVVLHQGDGALAFFSRPFVERHHKLATYKRELIGFI